MIRVLGQFDGVLLAVPLFSWSGEGVTWPVLAIAAGAGVAGICLYHRMQRAT